VIFSIQRYLEDHFNRRALSDSDQYAVTLARLYDRDRAGKTEPQFLAAMQRIRTRFYKGNDIANRVEFSRHLLRLMDAKFKKKPLFSSQRQSLKKLKPRAAA